MAPESRMNLHPRISEIVHRYLFRVGETCPGLVEGFYLYGSVSLGDYSLELSDIDFIAVTGERLTPPEIDALGAIHKEVERTWPKPNLNGIYVIRADIGKLPKDVAPFPYYVGGRMHKQGYFEMNMVTWYELKYHGICVVGVPVAELGLSIDMDLLLANMHENLNTYWSGWIARATRRSSFYAYMLYISRAQIEWGVLGITRLYCTFREKRVTSKAGAGGYALQTVPERWHRIIRESINHRRGVKKSLYRSVFHRKSDAIAYMRYMLAECNHIARA